MAIPYMIRWLRSVANSEWLSYRAKSVAASIFLHADMSDGHNCKVGIPKIAMDTGLGQTTVKKGLGELEESGHLVTHPLPSYKWHKEGALRRAVFPGDNFQYELVEIPSQAQGDRDGSHPSRPGRPGRPQPKVNGQSAPPEPQEAAPVDVAPGGIHTACPKCGDEYFKWLDESHCQCTACNSKFAAFVR